MVLLNSSSYIFIISGEGDEDDDDDDDDDDADLEYAGQILTSAGSIGGVPYEAKPGYLMRRPENTQDSSLYGKKGKAFSMAINAVDISCMKQTVLTCVCRKVSVQVAKILVVTMMMMRKMTMMPLVLFQLEKWEQLNLTWMMRAVVLLSIHLNWNCLG
jgi:hypothetical protein